MKLLMQLKLAITALSVAGSAMAFDVAVTVDDIPMHGPLPPGLTRLDIARAHLKAYADFGVAEAFGFVNARGAEKADDPVLAAWRKAGHPLGNHTFSHMNLRRAPSTEAWTADVLAGEAVLEEHMAGADWRWFRYPNLVVGDGVQHDTALAFLRNRGYRLADVSLNFSDASRTDAYVRCKAAGDEVTTARITEHYLRGVDHGINQALADSQTLYGRTIPLVLLTHMGAFSAVTLPDVLTRLKAAGAKFVPLAQAQADTAYARFGGGTLFAREARARKIELPGRLAPQEDPLDFGKLCTAAP